MKENNVILDKSKGFAVRIIKLYKYLCEEKKEFTLSKQLLRSGTSIDPSRKPVLHVHEYKPDNFHDRNARPLTKEEYKKYKKYFKGLN